MSLDAQLDLDRSAYFAAIRAGVGQDYVPGYDATPFARYFLASITRSADFVLARLRGLGEVMVKIRRAIVDGSLPPAMIDGLAYACVNRHIRAGDYIRLTGRSPQSTNVTLRSRWAVAGCDGRERRSLLRPRSCTPPDACAGRGRVAYPWWVTSSDLPDDLVPPAVREAILAWYAATGRELAFRATADPYAVLVSELMAQQTQAERAAEAWTRWMARWPTVRDLAAAPVADVVREWAGLGYNRRAVSLHRAAQEIVRAHGGEVPSSVEALEALPGSGRTRRGRWRRSRSGCRWARWT